MVLALLAHVPFSALAGTTSAAVKATPPKHSATRQQLPYLAAEHRPLAGRAPSSSQLKETLRKPHVRVAGTSCVPRKWIDRFAFRTTTSVREMLSTTDGARLLGWGHQVFTMP